MSDDDDKPMTKAEARAWIKRTREALRVIESAIKDGDEQLIRDWLIEWTAPGCEVENALDGPGIKGVH